MNVAFVTHCAKPGLTPDDRIAADALRRRGVRVDAVPWDSAADWRSYDAVVVRSTWDYHRRIDEFLRWIDEIETARVRLWNPPSVVRWNHDKRYLEALAAAGVPTAPTVRCARGDARDLAAILREQQWNEAVVKPTVSATAYRTWACTAATAAARQREFDEMLRDGDVLVQAFVPEIRTAGEWSLVFFAGAFSHSVLKRPREGDFRSQADFGGTSIVARPSAAVIAAARRVLDVVREPWLYARVDGVEVQVTIEDRFVLMELELIEPLLYFSTDAAAAPRFADALASVAC